MLQFGHVIHSANDASRSVSKVHVAKRTCAASVIPSCANVSSEKVDGHFFQTCGTETIYVISVRAGKAGRNEAYLDALGLGNGNPGLIPKKKNKQSYDNGHSDDQPPTEPTRKSARVAKLEPAHGQSTDEFCIAEEKRILYCVLPQSCTARYEQKRMQLDMRHLFNVLQPNVNCWKMQSANASPSRIARQSHAVGLTKFKCNRAATRCTTDPSAPNARSAKQHQPRDTLSSHLKGNTAR